jgi:hypothetical protein
LVPKSASFSPATSGVRAMIAISPATQAATMRPRRR